MNIGSTSYLPEPLPLLSGSALKIIAVVSMVIDHYAYYLMDGNTMTYEVMRCFGRIAFPVFAFLVAEGFAHTRNRMRYFLSLMLFAVVSEVPWYLLNGADGTHNVMFTLALGVSALAVFERLREHRILCCFFILLTAWLATWLGTDYEWRGVLLIVVSYLFGIIRSMNTPIILRRMMQLLFVFPLMMHYGIIGALLACAVIFLYDGTRGFIHGNVAKYGFYAFYPVHLITILIINMSYEF